MQSGRLHSNGEFKQEVLDIASTSSPVEVDALRRDEVKGKGKGKDKKKKDSEDTDALKVEKTNCFLCWKFGTGSRSVGSSQQRRPS